MGQGKDALDIRQTIIDLAIMVVIGLALAVIGPFGSFHFDLATRVAYWVPFSLLGYAIFRPIVALARWIATKLDLPEWPTVIAGLCVAAAPMSLLLFWADGQWGVLPSFDAFLRMYVYVALIGSVIYSIFVLIERGKGKPTEPAEMNNGNGDGTSRFLARLPSHFPLPLVALEMEDHYVRAHGSGGSELILMRLRDAIAELDGTQGAQVHRSWWVARDAVAGARRDGRKWRLILNSDLEAPVARERTADLRERGWF